MNSVALYQNGIAAFERVFEVSDTPTTITLLFNNASDNKGIGDVIGTMKVIDAGTILVPPNYTPVRQKPSLTLTPGNITNDLFNGLMGANVEITLVGSRHESLRGRVMGLETDHVYHKDDQAVEYLNVVVIDSNNNIRRLTLSGPNRVVESYVFTDKKVQAEIDRALGYNMEKNYPNSTMVSFVCQKEKPGKCRVRYTAQTPAWKWSYRASNTKDGWKLSGFAVVDNDSDEDWNDFTVTFSTGQPITFSSDLATVRIPQRSHVNFVRERVQDAVQADVGLEAIKAPSAGRRAPSPRALEGVAASLASFGPPPAGASASDADALTMGKTADVNETGGEHHFTCSEKLTVKSHRSALCPIFSMTLPESESILYYNAQNNNARPMKAILLQNTANFGFGYGPCEMEENKIHQGMAVLMDCKPGEKAILCHAVEMGVKCSEEQGQTTKRCAKHVIAKGVLITEFITTTSTIYRFKNVNNTSYLMLIDYTRRHNKSFVTCSPGLFKEDMKNGDIARLEFTLLGTDDVQTFTVTEKLVEEQRLEGAGVMDWTKRNPDSPLLKTKEMASIADLGRQLTQVEQDLSANEAKVKALYNEQERLRANIASLAGRDCAKMQARLVTTEEDLQKSTNEVIPGLKTRQNDLTNRIREALAKVQTHWTAD